jgi:copper oxidase (laccase) domain-containing protein
VSPVYELTLLHWEKQLQRDLGKSILNLVTALSAYAAEVRNNQISGAVPPADACISSDQEVGGANVAIVFADCAPVHDLKRAGCRCGSAAVSGK